jgi:hypothetical protein
MAKEKSRRKPASPIEVTMTRAEADRLRLELVSAKVAAYHVGTSKAMVLYWASRGYIKKYYVFGNTYNYEVDLNEVNAQPDLGYERKRQLHNTNWHLIPRTENGSRWVKMNKNESETNDGV